MNLLQPLSVEDVLAAAARCEAGSVAEQYLHVLMDFVEHGTDDHMIRPTQELGRLKDEMKQADSYEFSALAYRHAKRIKAEAIALAMRFDETLCPDDFAQDREGIEQEAVRLNKAPSVGHYAEGLLIESVTAGPDFLRIAEIGLEGLNAAESYLFAVHIVQVLAAGGHIDRLGAGAYEGDYGFALQKDVVSFLEALPKRVARSDKAQRLRRWLEEPRDLQAAFVLE